MFTFKEEVMMFKIAVLNKWQLVKIESRDQQHAKAAKAAKEARKAKAATCHSLPCMHLILPLIHRVPGAKVVIGLIRVFRPAGTGSGRERSILYIPKGEITR